MRKVVAKTGESKMSALVEATNLIHELAAPARAGEGVKAAQQRACRKLPNWSFNRVRDVWIGRPQIVIHGDELEQLRAVVAAKTKEKANAERDELLARIERLEARLAVVLGEDRNDFSKNGSDLRADR